MKKADKYLYYLAILCVILILAIIGGLNFMSFTFDIIVASIAYCLYLYYIEVNTEKKNDQLFLDYILSDIQKDNHLIELFNQNVHYDELDNDESYIYLN